MQDVNTLKMKFADGQMPTGQDFEDLIDVAAYSNTGIGYLTPGDTMAAPTGSKRMMATQAGSYANLKKADGSAAVAISVSAGDLENHLVFLDYTYSSDSWAKVLQNANGPAGPAGAPVTPASGVAVAWTERC